MTEEVIDLIFFLLISGILIAALMKWVRFPKAKPIPVMGALKEIVGRSTEMGRPVFTDPGRWSSMSSSRSMAGFAGLSILTHVAHLCAEVDCPFVLVTQNAAALPMITESIESQYLEYPSSQPPDIRFLPGVSGNPYENVFISMIEREKAGAVVSVGPVGTSSGLRVGGVTRTDAMSVMGTDRVDLIALMAVCCDYIVIGEEMFALGALLGGEETLLSSIGAQDVLKVLAIGLILIGLILANLGIPFTL
jgi:hypothetical protein